MTTATAPTASPTANAPDGSAVAPDVTPQTQAGLLLTQVAGYMGVRVIDMGLRSGLVAAIGERPGLTSDDLAETLDMDQIYVAVWCRAALGVGILDRADGGYRLAPHIGTLLLDDSSPAYVGGMFPLIQQPEMFGHFAERLTTGERMWWDETTPDWIAGVAGTGRPFYSRLVPAGLDRIDGLADRLRKGCRIADTACGAGAGLIRLAKAYPNCEIVGVDGDQHSIDQARAAVEAAGIADRVQLVCSPLEEMELDVPVTAIVNNISMHECREIDTVTARFKAALEPGGWFVISDFPFPDTDEGLRSVPGRIMSGIQFFEAQIDDQLLPRAAYDDLLTRHGFQDLDSFSLSPVHAVTHGRTPS